MLTSRNDLTEGFQRQLYNVTFIHINYFIILKMK